jgi:UDP-N-acetylglucosamine:LPS N-acetylglucosamine transferase
VLVLTADIGEGHDLPARELAAAVRRSVPGADASVIDGLAAMGRILRAVVRDGSKVTLRWLPWIFELQYFLLARLRPTRWLAGKLLYALGSRPLSRLIDAQRPDVIVSTYPGVTAVLGELRRRGRLALPTVSAITDLAGLRFWAHPGIDLHLVTHPEAIAEVERIAGPGGVRLAQPPTAPAFLAPRSRADARAALGLRDDGHVVVVSGGGWGVGDLRGSVEAALRTDAHTVVCLCGRNERVRQSLERRFGSEPRVRIVSFTERMSDTLAAADVLVHSTAGLTVLEAQIRGCQVVSYGFGVGHIRLNNRAYRRFGLARTAATRRGLAAALQDALANPREADRSFERLPDPAALVCAARPRVKPLAAWRMRATRLATAAAVAFVAFVGSLATDASYPLLASALDLHPLTTVSTTRPEVGLLIDAPASQSVALARALYAHGAKASFEFESPPDAASLAVLHALGDDAVPHLRGGGTVRWFRTKGQLRRAARDLGLSGHFFYAVPHDGFTMAQYVLAHAAGASPVTGALQLNAPDRVARPSRGAVVEVHLGAGAPDWPPALASLLAGLRERGMRTVGVPSLVAGGR